MEQILLDNAYEAWENAIYYHSCIIKGFFTLGNKKGFVSSLHNAVELFLKQIMLNEKDTDVAWVGKIKSKEEAQLQLDYYNATDLNEYFSQLSSEELNKYSSIEYSKLLEKVNKLISVDDKDKKDFKDALKKLKDLRNNETHFYINDKEYLKEDDFLSLCRFMVLFYNIINEKGLFPTIKFDATDGQVTNRDYRYVFDDDFCDKNFAYMDTLKKNKYYKVVIEYITAHKDYNGDAEVSDVENLAWIVCYDESRKTSKERFCRVNFKEQEKYRKVISLMKKYGIIEITQSEINEYHNETSGEWEFEQLYHVKIIN